jgi:rod shape-determining protein MreB
MTQENKKLHIGIDLGTSRSSTAASNGEKKWITSYVGWPKDFVAAQVVGKEVLFGDDALENRLSLDICRPLERGIIREGIERSEEAVKAIIRHLVELVSKDSGADIHAVIGVPAESLNVNKLAIRNAVSDYVHSLMVVSEPFAVAYGMGLLSNALIIDIGAGTTDFCIMHGAIPGEDDQRTTLSAGDHIDDQLYSILSDKYPQATFNINMVRQFKEQFSFVGDLDDEVKVELLVDGKPVTHDIWEEMKRACESILPALIETTTEMIAGFDPEFQAKVKKNIILAGGGSLIRGIDTALQKALKEYGPSSVTCVEDPLFSGALGALKLAQDMPASYWETL